MMRSGDQAALTEAQRRRACGGAHHRGSLPRLRGGRSAAGDAWRTYLDGALEVVKEWRESSGFARCRVRGTESEELVAWLARDHRRATGNWRMR